MNQENSQSSGLSGKKFDLEDRTLDFAKRVIDILKQLPKTQINSIHADQLTRSSGSMGANYIEANDSLGKKDFYMRIRIARKESKESKYWLQLILHNNPEYETTIAPLIKEVEELIRIFSAIIKKAN